MVTAEGRIQAASAFQCTRRVFLDGFPLGHRDTTNAITENTPRRLERTLFLEEQHEVCRVSSSVPNRATISMSLRGRCHLGRLWKTMNGVFISDAVVRFSRALYPQPLEPAPEDLGSLFPCGSILSYSSQLGTVVHSVNF